MYITRQKTILSVYKFSDIIFDRFYSRKRKKKKSCMAVKKCDLHLKCVLFKFS